MGCFSGAWKTTDVSENQCFWNRRHLGPQSFYLMLLRVLLIMLRDRINQFFGLLSNKKNPVLCVDFRAQFTLISINKIKCDCITFMFALSPSSLARLCNSAYFIKFKSMFAAFLGGFVLRSWIGSEKAARRLESSGFKQLQERFDWLLAYCRRKCLASNQNEDGLEPFFSNVAQNRV